MPRPQQERLLWLNAVAAGTATDCHAALEARVSLLLQGPQPATEACIALLTPDMIHPVVHRRPRAALKLPARHVGGVVLEHVESLTSDEQMRLLDWLDAQSQRTQLVSTSAAPLFDVVLRGGFAEALYYRLNIVLINIGVETLRQTVPMNQSEDFESDIRAEPLTQWASSTLTA